MASTNVKTVLQNDLDGFKVVKIVLTCATDSAEFSNVIIKEAGKALHKVRVDTTGSATGPLDNSDIAITDGATGVNVLNTNGANIVDNDANNVVDADTTDIVLLGNATLAITGNTNVGADVTVYLYLHDVP